MTRNTNKKKSILMVVRPTAALQEEASLPPYVVVLVMWLVPSAVRGYGVLTLKMYIYMVRALMAELFGLIV